MRWSLASTSYTSTNKYAALKIYAHDLVAEDEIDNETAIYKHLSTARNPDHPGKMYVRTIQDSFWGYAVDTWNVGVLVRDFLPVANSTKLMRASRSGTCLRTDACSMGLTRDWQVWEPLPPC